MIIRAAGNDVKASFDKHFSHCLCVLYNLLLISFKFGLHSFLESDRFCGDYMHQWTTLDAGEDI